MGLINCIIYLILSGLTVFFIGRIYPRKRINENGFWFKPFKFEKSGRLYDKLKIKRWKTKLPDASVIISKIIPSFMPKKRLEGCGKDKIEILIKETCVAEATHIISGVLGLFCIRIWKKFGWIISMLWLAFNTPFVLIQRYNRPRLISALAK